MAITTTFSFFTLIMTLFPASSIVFIPIIFLFSAAGLAGFVLYMVGIKGLSVRYQTPAIFNNALYALLTSIIGTVVIAGVAFAIIFASLSSAFRSLIPAGTTTDTLNSTGLLANILIPVMIAALVVGLISTMFYYRSFNILSEKTNIKRFKTVGLLFPVGVIAAFLLMLIGAIFVAMNFTPITNVSIFTLPSNGINCAAWILAAKAFFSLKAPIYQTPTVTPTVPSSPIKVKYCNYCGAQNIIDATYCANCGKPIQPTL